MSVSCYHVTMTTGNYESSCKTLNHVAIFFFTLNILKHFSPFFVDYVMSALHKISDFMVKSTKN